MGKIDMIIDCHYCEYAACASPDDKTVSCYIDDNGYFDHHVRNSKEEAKKCHYFEYDDYFPKY